MQSQEICIEILLVGALNRKMRLKKYVDYPPHPRAKYVVDIGQPYIHPLCTPVPQYPAI